MIHAHFKAKGISAYASPYAFYREMLDYPEPPLTDENRIKLEKICAAALIAEPNALVRSDLHEEMHSITLEQESAQQELDKISALAKLCLDAHHAADTAIIDSNPENIAQAASTLALLNQALAEEAIPAVSPLPADYYKNAIEEVFTTKIEKQASGIEARIDQLKHAGELLKLSARKLPAPSATKIKKWADLAYHLKNLIAPGTPETIKQEMMLEIYDIIVADPERALRESILILDEAKAA